MDQRLTKEGLLVLLLIGTSYRPAASETSTKRDYQRDLDRHAVINPVAQSTGVSAGLVIAYGHVISAPYRFHYRGDKLFVNGVQLVPSPVSEKENEKLLALVTSDKKKFFEEYDRVERRARKMFEDRRSHEEILQFIKSQTAVVADAKWEGEDVMRVRLVGDKDVAVQPILDTRLLTLRPSLRGSPTCGEPASCA